MNRGPSSLNLSQFKRESLFDQAKASLKKASLLGPLKKSLRGSSLGLFFPSASAHIDEKAEDDDSDLSLDEVEKTMSRYELKKKWRIEQNRHAAGKRRLMLAKSMESMETNTISWRIARFFGLAKFWEAVVEQRAVAECLPP